MNFKALRHTFIDQIKEIYGEEETLSIFYIVINYLFGWTRAQLILNLENQLTIVQEKAFLDITSELKKGRPIQYVIGETIFYGLKFYVNSSVLIPRVETEELIDWMIQKLKNVSDNSKNIIDIGTGSGCIAVTLKKNLPALDLDALEISSDALSVARSNALLNEVDVHFIEGNILNYSSDVKYDVIVSNPPYIKEDEMLDMHPNVLEHEPHLALFVNGDRPLLFYEVISDFALKNLRDGGLLFFEINTFFGKEMVDLLNAKGFTDIELKKDMQGKDRMLVSRMKFSNDSL